MIEWSWRVISGDTNDVNDWTWTLLMLAATVRSFAHMPLGISDRNNTRPLSAAQKPDLNSCLRAKSQICATAFSTTGCLWKHNGIQQRHRPFQTFDTECHTFIRWVGVKPHHLNRCDRLQHEIVWECHHVTFHAGLWSRSRGVGRIFNLRSRSRRKF